MITVNAAVTIAFQARKLVSASATMGFEAGQPVDEGAATLYVDPWISMYPG